MSSVTPDRPPRSDVPDGTPARVRRGAPPPPRRPTADGSLRSRAPLAVAAAVAVGWAALLSYAPVALLLGLVGLSEDSTNLSGALGAGVSAWLLGHGVPLQTATGPLGLTPLALAALAGWRLVRAGVHTSRAIGGRGSGSYRLTFAAAAGVGVAYGVLGAVAALLAGLSGTEVSLWRAASTLAVFAALAALVGAARTTGALGVLARTLPPPVRDGIRTGIFAAVLLLAVGAAVSGLAVALGGAEAGDMIGAYRTGLAGQAGITLISLAYLPNLAVWAVAYLLGPGFAVGVDTTVRTTEVSLGALPAVPLLAGLPHEPLGVAGGLLLALPVLVAMIAGWLLARRTLRLAEHPAVPGWRRLLGAAAVAGPVAGLLLGAVAAASGGALGAGRMAQLGPVAWQVGLMAAVVIAAGALAGAAAGRRFAPPPPRRNARP